MTYTSPTLSEKEHILGAGFAIFASAYISLVILLVVLEQLGVQARLLDVTLFLVPLAFYAVIGVSTRAFSAAEFFAGSHRALPLYNAMAVCAPLFGGSVVLGSIGTMFFIGIDGIALLLGCFAGVVLMALLFIPFVRKAGAYTVPGLLSIRFASGKVRVVAALLAFVPCLLLVTAEVTIAERTASLLLGKSIGDTFPVLGLVAPHIPLLIAVLLSIVFGGIRSSTWTASAQFIVFACLLAPLVTVAVARSNLPLPQLTYGGQIEQTKAFEAAREYAVSVRPEQHTQALPTVAPASLTRPVEKAFSALSTWTFVCLVLTVAMGVAVFPSFLPRLGMVTTPALSRRSAGWVTAFAAAMVLTLPAYAFFTKAMAVESLVGVPASDLPGFTRTLREMGLVGISTSQFDQTGAGVRASFQRDTAAFILPVAGLLPRALGNVTFVAILAAICACIGAQLLAIAKILSSDLMGFRSQATPTGERRQLFLARVAMAACAAAAFAIPPGLDALRLALAAFAFAGATFFPVLVLSIWWRELNAIAALAAMVSGAAVSAAMLLAGETAFGADGVTSGVLGALAGFAAAFLIRMISGAPDQKCYEAVDDLRIPAGETLHARMLRVAVRAKPKAA
jgi:cation/acetate symporter